MKQRKLTSTFSSLLQVAVSVSALTLLTGVAQADDTYCTVKKCKTHLRGRVLDNSTTNETAIGANTERERAADAPNVGYAISVDGEVVSGSEKLADRQRETDVALEKVDIQVKFDGLDVKPILNVSTAPVRRTYQAGEEVDFLVSLNYGAWVDHGEIRIYEADTSAADKPAYVIPVSQGGTAIWHMPAKGAADFTYTLRVYDSQGRFDETRHLTLSRSARKFDQHEPENAAVAPGFGEDGTALRNIPVYGGAVTVFGNNVPGQDSVVIMGERVPVDPDGKFVVQRILPPGDHSVSVKVADRTAKGLEFYRDINIPSSEWFYVGLADVTFGKRFGSKDIASVSPGEYNDIYTKGRLAFYVKGKIKGRTLLTAAGDTGEDKLQNLFKGLDAKDPRQFLRRIDPDKYYPVYGDDSTAIEDAPTRGKFYVRLERGDSHVMWGNFKTRVTGTTFLRNERALYGANAVYRSDEATRSGERRTEATAYAAQPGTLPQRDVLRGTGGSAYFLKHQDVTVGSETVSVVVVDRVTNTYVDRRPLKYGVDYDIDYTQGVIILRKPLPSTQGTGAVVRDGALDGNPVNLVVSYEYTPAATDVNGYSLGGRAQQWMGDHVRVGVTGAREKTGAANQTLIGADVKIQKTEGTYLEVEVAQTRGPGFGNSTSSDGGATITDVLNAGTAGQRANGYRAEAHIDIADLTNGSAKGNLEAHIEDKQAGFSTIDEQVPKHKRDIGIKGNLELSEAVSIAGGYTRSAIAGGSREQSVDAQATVKLNQAWSISPGVRYSQKHTPTGTAQDNGSRADIGVKLGYKPDDDHSAYVFGQFTALHKDQRKRNDRIGVGGETKLSEKVTGTGEVSYGTSGFGGLAQLAYNPTADDTYYMGYRLDPDRDTALGSPFGLTGDDLGAIVAGAKHRYSERLSIFAEDSYDLYGARKTLAQTYGVTYTPDAAWSIGGNMELGQIIDNTVNPVTGIKNSDFDRKAFSLSTGYKGEDGNSARVKGEVRLEDSQDHTRDLTSYLLSASVGMKANENWRFLGNFDAVLANATQSTRDGDYVEASLGYAYRPVDNDRLNLLFKYNFLFDKPGIDQVTAAGTTSGPAQRSHILSADVNYDISKIITLGAKYGFRIGDTKPRDGSAGWTTSSAHLGILRADLNIVKNWDALIEGRALWSPSSDTAHLAALGAIYRHFGDNFKVGIGYNFGVFTDDLRDQSLHHSGVFINAIGKF
jgi:hypothetical protein